MSHSVMSHMIKFKGRSSMKQYIKLKPIKWGLKWWFKYASSNGYLYEFNLYLGQKKNAEANLGDGDVPKLSEELEGTYCALLWTIFRITFIDKQVIVEESDLCYRHSQKRLQANTKSQS